MEWLVWIESWSLSVWVRESGSLWSYPTVLFLHTVGLAFAVGMSAVIALRVLGAASAMPLPLRDQSSGIRPISHLNNALAVISLVLWTGAILAGRLMAYIGPVSGVDVS